uniref:VP3 n=1 Tax=Liao ning virus TaxID=246280 RepID=A0A2P1N6P7_9REOV|nr:VP3 [Liao ning virus]
MLRFQDDNSIPSKFISEVNGTVLRYVTLDHDGTGFRKSYPNINERLYYALGDAYEAGVEQRPLLITSEEVKYFRNIGFLEVGEESTDSKTAYLRRAFVRNYNDVIGVEPNGLKALSKSRNGLNIYDMYDYVTTFDPIGDFKRHCMQRWKLSYPPDLEAIQYKLATSYDLNYKRMFNDNITLEESKVESPLDKFTQCTYEKTSYHMNGNNIKTEGLFGFSPKLSFAQQNGRLKNEYVTKGLIMTHHKYIFIGDSPGPHYNEYSKILNPNNCISYDPRDLSYGSLTTHYKQMFTYADIPKVVAFCNSAHAQGLYVLVRIDIRSDKPKMSKGELNSEWESGVQADNELTASLINALPINVTIIAKLRPSYNVGNEAPHLNKRFRLLPLPFLTHTTAEFSIFVPRGSLTKTSLTNSYKYDDLKSMTSKVCALKRTCGALYNMFLCDLYLNLGVTIKQATVSNDSIALFSLSNISNPMPELNSVKNYLLTFPYTSIVNTQTTRVTHGRVYVDNAFNMFHEYHYRDSLVIPLAALPVSSHNVSSDFTNVVVTDNFDVIRMTQPIEQVSTHMVKLVNFVLKRVCRSVGVNFTELNKRLRREALEEFVTRNPSYVMFDNETAYSSTGRMTVSGHMMYILLGSMLGVPYGLVRYLREIEINIMKPSVSYERGFGSRVWHGYHSHRMAVDVAVKMITALAIVDRLQIAQLLEFANWYKSRLDGLAVKYGRRYTDVDETDHILTLN